MKTAASALCLSSMLLGACGGGARSATTRPTTVAVPEPPYESEAMPRSDPVVCLAERAWFGSDDAWILGCPPDPEPLNSVRPCRLIEGDHRVDFTYDASGRPLAADSSVGPDVHFVYGEDGLLSAIDLERVGTIPVTHEGSTVEFHLGIARRFEVEDGRVARYSTLAARVPGIVDADGRLARIEHGSHATVLEYECQEVERRVHREADVDRIDARALRGQDHTP